MTTAVSSTRATAAAVDRVDEERLLVERVGVAGVAVLVGGRLEEADRRHVAARRPRPRSRSGRTGGSPGRSCRSSPTELGGEVVRVGRRRVVLERLVVRDVVALLGCRRPSVRRTGVDGRVQSRAKPPWNQPQVTRLAFSRSPTFLLVGSDRGACCRACRSRRRSAAGRRSRVPSSWPVTAVEPVCAMPCVWPETRLSAPASTARRSCRRSCRSWRSAARSSTAP